jgi:ATP-dependent phosphofructokinase / diphosphate-dependent phosphofructokinase
MADEFLNNEGNDVTDAFKNYVRPLVGALPTMARLSAPTVAKILKKD